MAEGIDVSSYKQPPLPTALDTVQKLGNLQQQKQQIESGALTIDKQKLDLMNQQYGYLIRELNSVGPNPNADDLNKVAKNAVTMGIIKPDMYANFIRTMPTDPSQMAAFRDKIATTMASTAEAVNFHYGSKGYLDTGNAQTPISTTPRQGAVSTGPAIPTQPSVQSTVLSPETNEPGLRGPRPPIVPPGMAAGPPRGGPGNPLPIAPPNVAMPPPVGTSNAMYEAQPQPATTAVPTPRPRSQALPVAPPPLTPNQRVAQGDPGLRTGMSPLFEAGKAQLVTDQNDATGRLTALKPALQALPLLKDLTTGIGTETYNKAIAGLSNLGLVPQGVTDKAAAYQIVNKKLADYLRSSPLAGRSDAAQALSQSASPDPKGQINQALVKLTKDAIVLDRVQIARPGAFTKETVGPDGKTVHSPNGELDKYGEHRSTFPGKVDERAFGIDLMEPKDRQKLLDEMHKKQNTFEGKKFWTGLSIAVRQGMIDPELLNAK